MSPKRIDDQFSHLPKAIDRQRARWQARGGCTRCGRQVERANYANCDECLAYHEARRRAKRK